MSLGVQLFSIAKLLHQSIFVNGTLVNMETWPNCTEKRVSDVEKVEQNFMRKILKAHSKTPIEALYLELGIILGLLISEKFWAKWLRCCHLI